MQCKIAKNEGSEDKIPILFFIDVAFTAHDINNYIPIEFLLYIMTNCFYTYCICYDQSLLSVIF
jgi:hypothetical protein